MKSLKYMLGAFSLFLFLLTTACQPATPACPPGSITYLPDENESQSHNNQENSPTINGQTVEIKGQEIQVDQVVRGMLCSGSWRGTIYVPCQVQVYAWEEDPTFLKNCDLVIEPGTVVYVAAHNDAPYYQGCSCHTGEIGE